MIRLKSLLTESALAADTDFRSQVKSWEGTGPLDANGNHLAYDDKNPSVPAKPGQAIEGTLTIGYGATKAVYPKLKPGAKITPAEAEQLLTKGIKEHETKARRLIPKYDTLPDTVRKAIVNAIYRGDLGPKTIGLINAEKWDKVPTQYLDHPNYTNPGKLTGVVKRMKSNADAFADYAKKLAGNIKDRVTGKHSSNRLKNLKTANTNLVGKMLYTKPGNFQTYTRTEPVVDNGIIDNVDNKLAPATPIGTVIKAVKGEDSKLWYLVKYPDGSGTGYVRSDVIKTNNSKYYTVKPGDQLLKIALDNATTLDDLKSLNMLTNTELTAGQKIRLY
jgi:GH24 family phage-related lysozyme (muramidase)